ncbi:selenocysteine lyase/cysteine desulfurase [Microbacterium endophyticum]|uniref:Selenocysteine lyase/cysteine desulfurase n=1 Tax=Microbacterium endophyticum TaxID=1526412 RepID=A0A7W4V0M1_9MICO|nr:aminotransferase class V-fold PLP-dependent enzyme [Microbacterium endophyticum]MBB2974683.1 selenocysteine lyase/cysteine desulfurase [Microbacterium endophyticum]NIK36980.1 selenocysteine lyase/cysteine desulfurase [Microbacterium endophyticum]
MKTITSARTQFSGGRGYLASCTVGLPTRATRAAIIADLDSAAGGHPDLADYTSAVERSRRSFARLVKVAPQRVAIGSQASVMTALVASALPERAEVLVADGDFSSIVLPFVHAGRDFEVRCVPLRDLAAEIQPQTALVAFSLVQSATGEVADVGEITRAARAHGTLTLCDATQAVGWFPVEASVFDAVICHAYKWLCAPRGVSFLTVSNALLTRASPLFAGWYAGENPWDSCYGDAVTLASDARRFDVSPAWQAFVGAAPALALFARTNQMALYSHTTHLARLFREEMDLPEPTRESAIITWLDDEGTAVTRLASKKIVASGRAGRARVAFHIYNDEEDVDLAVSALKS